MYRKHEASRLPSVDEYVSGLKAITPYINDIQRRLLVEQYKAPDRTVTASELARLADIKDGYPTGNAQYGHLAHMLCDAIAFEPDKRKDGRYHYWPIWSVGYSTPEGFKWEMLSEVAEALEELRWVAPEDVRLTEEVIPGKRLVEGATRRVTVNAYERNRAARNECIKHHGTNRFICGFNFGAIYGALAEGFTHVHHLKPLSEVDGEYRVKPEEDLRPVCPNCHAVIHLGGTTRSIEEVKALLRE